MNYLYFFPFWFGSMSWHLWRIATFRPAFARLGDTKLVALSFIGVFFFASLLRWGWFLENNGQHSAGMHWGAAFWKALVHFALVLFLCERKNTSSSLTAAALGSSAVVDFAVVFLFCTGYTSSVSPMPWLTAGLEVVYILVLSLQFESQPEEVRSSGYKDKARPIA